jgi:hypothetical protein
MATERRRSRKFGWGVDLIGFGGIIILTFVFAIWKDIL